MEPWEADLDAGGAGVIAGLDEVGRGALFGPVVAGAVVLAPGTELDGVDDSKRLTPPSRARVFRRIVARADDWSVGLASAAEIDEINVLEATRLAMMRALCGLSREPDHLLIDALALEEVATPQTALVKGDARCLSIAAASIVAKVTRDTLLVAYGRHFPGYGLERNMGYGTREHRRAIMERGFSELHRRSFRVQGELPFAAGAKTSAGEPDESRGTAPGRG